MKNWKKIACLLMALTMSLSMAACGDKAPDEPDGYEYDEEYGYSEGEIDDGIITLDDLTGYWSPVEGLGSTTSALTCIYLDAANEMWEEYDQYGDLTGYTGSASTDGEVLTLSDVPLIGDVDIPIGDADTLVTDTGETYWVKGYPDFLDKAALASSYYGNWYLRGDHDSEYATVMTLNEDGTFSWYGAEGTYTYSEFDQYVEDTTVFRQQIELSSSPFDQFYLVSDGKVLVRWSDASNGDEYYINIDFDHMGFLGNTLTEIAEKKAGIIKEAGTVVTAEQKKEVMDVFEKTCAEKHAQLIRTSAKQINVREKGLDGQCFDYENKSSEDMKQLQNITLSLTGDHQCGNAAVVFQIMECLNEKGYHISENALREGMRSVRWPGRFEVVSKDPLVIIDGAHNPDGIHALSHNLKEYCPDEKFVFITGILKDKDYHEMLTKMLFFADSFVTIAPDNPRAMSAEECAAAIRACGFDGEVVASANTEQAVSAALQMAKEKSMGVCAFGSLYSVGALHASIHIEMELLRN